MKFANTNLGGEQGDPVMPLLQPRHPQRIERSETRNVGWGGTVCVPG